MEIQISSPTLTSDQTRFICEYFRDVSVKFAANRAGISKAAANAIMEESHSRQVISAIWGVIVEDVAKNGWAIHRRKSLKTIR